MTNRFLIFALTLWATMLFHKGCEGAVIFLYDFPGNPGSGLAASQADGQPTGAIFGDVTRTSVLSANGSDVFNSKNWNQTGVLNPAEYVSFSITASGGYHLNLTSLTFDALRFATGPTDGVVNLFLNGSATAYATFNYNLAAANVTVSETFNFTPLTDTDDVTSAEFRFYGLNSGGAGGTLEFDNVATNGAISNVPEPGGALFALLPVVLGLWSLKPRAVAKG